MPMAPRVLLLCLLGLAVTESHGREAAIPGCHLHPFNVTVRSDRQGTCQGSHVAQACVGHCESSAFPSRYSVLVASGYRHNITSVSQCCTISSLKKVRVWLHCVGNQRGSLRSSLPGPASVTCAVFPAISPEGLRPQSCH